MDSRYEIRISGHLGPLLRAAIVDGMRCEAVPRHTTISGRFSPAGLRRFLRRLDEYGLTLVRLDRTEPSPEQQASSSPDDASAPAHLEDSPASDQVPADRTPAVGGTDRDGTARISLK